MNLEKSRVSAAEAMKKKYSTASTSALVNSYPAYGAYRYGGSLPKGQYGHGGTQQVPSSDIWKRNPYVIPTKLRNFHLLCRQQESRSSNR